MSVPPLYAASVPVLLHYLERCDAIVQVAAAQPDALQARLAPDMFTAAQQFASAAEFAMRATCPLVGQDVPEFPQQDMDAFGLRRRIGFAQAVLTSLDPAEFDGAEARTVRHRAGFADLEQRGADYLHHFALPNFFFHLSMGFAVLRQQGLELGKADFDGQHDYPAGFRF